MKILLSIFVFALVFSCQNKSNQKPTDSEIKEQKAIDSLQKSIQDSLRIALELKEKYENRPWKMRTFVDEFGDPTDDRYISTFVEGTFSNSATSGDDLYVKIIIDEGVRIELMEYNLNSSPESFIGIGKLNLKNDHNYKLTLSLGGSENPPCVKVFESDTKKFFSFMKESKGIVKFNIKDAYSSNYNFNINVSGFEDEMKELENYEKTKAN